jgi:thiosulfate reductase cytochrome b subunit
MNGHNKVLLYTRFERIWHWGQAAFFLILFLTGFELHGAMNLLGYEEAHQVHIVAGWALLILTLFAIFWHMTTGAWRYYIPTAENLSKVANYYMRGIFKGEPHPFKKSATRKFNPLQGLAYLWLKAFAMPLLFLSGLFYFYYNNWAGWGINAPLRAVAVLHSSIAFLMLAFLVVHVYLASLGHTRMTHIREMITGYEEPADVKSSDEIHA